MLRRLSSASFNKLKNSCCNFSISYQQPLFIEHGLNVRLNNKSSCTCMTACTHYSLITVSMYLCRRIQTSLLALYHSQANCICKKKIVALNMSLFYCVVQSIFQDSQRFHLYTITKRHSHSWESGFARIS